jgi:hypothetical protein
MKQAAMAIALLLAALTSVASAQENDSCVCECVNGQVQAVCTNTLAVPPICAPRVCPIVPPEVTPIEPPTVPPVGTTECRLELVWNELTERYEWQTICR